MGPPTQSGPAAAGHPPGQWIGLIARTAVSALLVLLTAVVIVRYPLPAWSIACPLAAYAALLWWRPAIFLLVIPCVLHTVRAACLGSGALDWLDDDRRSRSVHRRYHRR